MHSNEFIKFYLRSAGFLLTAALIYFTAVSLSSWYVESNNFTNANTENSNLFFIKSNQDYDLMITGISHARMLSRDGNHRLIEDILDKKIINMGVGASKAGFVNLELYLRYFFARGNTADEMLYVLSPTMMFSNYVDNASDAFVLEPFSFRFARILLSNGFGNKWEQFFYYTRSKLNTMWLEMEPGTNTGNFAALDSVNHDVVQRGMKVAYLEGKDKMIFEERKKVLSETVEYLKAHGVKVTFIIAPALFGQWPGHNKVLGVLKEFKQKYGTEYHDLSQIITDPNYYYDHHHLNTNGVRLFAQNYLREFL